MPMTNPGHHCMCHTRRSLLQSKHPLEHVTHAVAIINVGQRVLPQPVPQAEGDDAVDVLNGNFRPALERSQRLGCAVGDDVSADAVDIEVGADL
jgi:hypothetical protein